VRRLAIPFLCLAAVTAACSGPAGEELATVDGVVITVDDVSELYSVDNIPIDANFRLAAFRLVALEVLEGAYEEDFDTEVDDAVVEEQFQTFLSEIEAQGLTVAEAFGVPDATENMVMFDARLTVIRDGVIEGIANDAELIAALQTQLAASPDLFTIVCTRHVLTPTEDAALAVIARLESGEDFAEVATEVSLDATPDGDLGCTAPGAYVPEFADATMAAEIGEIHGPVSTDFGFHVLIVDERTTPTADDLAAEPSAYLPAEQIQTLWVDWFNEQLADAEIEVNSKFGAWDAATLRIVAPPEG
jgi:parvulin-like peptidyl-prolyl isomerase